MIDVVPPRPVLALGQVRLRRTLPFPGEVLVAEGQQVGPDDVLVRATPPREPLVVPLATILGVRPYDILRLLRKQPGEACRAGEVLAQAGLLFRRTYTAPFAGTVTRVLPDRGAIVLAPAAAEVVLRAHVASTVARVLPDLGVELYVDGLVCRALAGGGPEAHGPLRVEAGPDEALTPERCGAACRGAVVVGGYLAPGTRAAAAQSGVSALVVGAVPGEVLGELAGGAEEPAIIVTHWLGRQAMPADAHAVLADLEGRTASVVHLATWLPNAGVAPLLLVAGPAARPVAQPVGAVVAGARRGTLLDAIDAPPRAVVPFGPLRGPVAQVRVRADGAELLPAWAVERWSDRVAPLDRDIAH